MSAKWNSSAKYHSLSDKAENEKLIPNDVTPLVPSEPTRDGLRPEIQGLRAIAICAVLLFHMWGAEFFLSVTLELIVSLSSPAT
ncbi:hypothetical protein M3Y97_01051400 [Aphelenchoides bicaudatus]|nr:hypothetical protein M3Y97_01051400 [Aphelenchoides bicaudatus]